MSGVIDDRRVEAVAITALTPYANNPRSHSPAQIRRIARSIETFGWTNPILVDGDGGVIAGHGRLAAARHLGLETVPVLRIDHLTAAQKRAYIIADNKLALEAGWDRELLAIELEGLIEADEFDLTLTGFEIGEIDAIVADDADGEDPADHQPEPDPGRPPVTRPGDVWCIGRHRLVCGDMRDPAVLDRLMAGGRARMIFTDPPYNVPVDGHVSGLGRVRHRAFAMASGEMDEAAFTRFLEEACRALVRAGTDGALHFVCMDWRHILELLTAGRAVYGELKNLCVWAKSNGGMGSLYRSRHELVAVFKQGTAPHVNNVELGRHGRYRTNLWSYPGVNAFGAGRDAALAMHPTVKPVRLVEDAIRDCSDFGDIVLDGFAGSGTTLLAAERAGRRGHGAEIDPRYVDIALLRLRDTFGLEPVHEESGLAFGTLA